MISVVVAASRNGVIGRDGGLPWHVSSDLKLFKQITMGKPVIMGRKTWDSLPRKPLVGRHNIVITRQTGFLAEGADVVPDVQAALALAARHKPAEIAVIGGGEIYKLVWPLADQIYLTEIDAVVEGDTFLPPIDPKHWDVVRQEAHERGPKDSVGFCLKILKRKVV
ncbi:MAG: dihydrofolate reductase [Alphaproteobacteria bacterium]|nr:dihydrofolate reductase [Alphaproteobacteria bacterium]